MSLVSKLQLLKVDNSVEQYGKTYDQLRSEIGSFLGHFEVPSYRGQRDFKSTEYEDLLISASAFFSSLKTILEAMTEAQDIIDNWDEGTPEDAEYAQAIGEVMMAKKLFINTVKDYDRLENLRYQTTTYYREEVSRSSGYYSPTKLQVGSADPRIEFFKNSSRRPDGADLGVQHPRAAQFSPGGWSTTTNIPSIDPKTYKKLVGIF